MKISITSDVHLEFGMGSVVNEDKADVLILSGDIFVAEHLNKRDWMYKRVLQFLSNCCNEFNHVLFVKGNHEIYGSDLNTVGSIIKENTKRLQNFHYLNNECLLLDDVKFLGGTGWTSMNNHNPITKLKIKDIMNDFILIKNGLRRFSPNDAALEHERFLSFVYQELEESVKNVVVSHHPPSFQFIHDRFKHDFHMNGGYCSNLDGFIVNNTCIKLWTCGHVHDKKLVRIGETEVVCNPRGYFGSQTHKEHIDLVTVEI